jgi:hypothetical protein
MKRAGLFFLAVVTCMPMTGVLSAPVSALEEVSISSTPTDFLSSSKLEVSGYGWEFTPAHTDQVGVNVPDQRLLSYIQLYNTGSVPIDLSEWEIRVERLDTEGVANCEKVVDCSSIALPVAIQEGYLAPHGHLVLAEAGRVEGAHPMNAIQLPVYQKSTVPWFRIVVRQSGYLEEGITAKIDSRTDSEHEYAYWQRNFSSTGQGYTDGFSAASSPPEALFNDSLYIPPEPPGIQVVEVMADVGAECSPFSVEIGCFEYIKLHIDDNEEGLARYMLRTDNGSLERTGSNSFWLGVATPADDGYVTVRFTDEGDPLHLTNSGGHVWIEDIYGMRRYEMTVVRYNPFGSAEQGMAWSRGEAGWQWTTRPNPYGKNYLVAPLKETATTVCPVGKYLNPDTGRCRTVEEAINTLATCGEGEYRNPETNRCRRITATTVSLTPCGEGQERNPLTNRCRSISSAIAELLPCDEGYERNPTTNRCRKILGETTGVTLPKKELTASSPEERNSQIFGWAAISLVVAGGLGYAVYEWRKELLGVWSGLTAKFHR